jgi:hypothetical protein
LHSHFFSGASHSSPAEKEAQSFNEGAIGTEEDQLDSYKDAVWSYLLEYGDLRESGLLQVPYQ